MTKLTVLDFHDIWLRSAGYIWHVFVIVLLGFSLPVKAAPHECEIRTSQP